MEEQPVVEPGQELGEPPQAVQVFLETLQGSRGRPSDASVLLFEFPKKGSTAQLPVEAEDQQVR